MNTTGWDWWDFFRLHQAACLIAGVPVVSKRVPNIDELPAEAVPVFKSLLSAWVLWRKFHDVPEDPQNPKSRMLEGLPTSESEKPLEFLVSRTELRRWIGAMGRDSAYQFLPVGASSATPEKDSNATHSSVDHSASETDEKDAFPKDASASNLSAKVNWRHAIQAEAYEHWIRLRASGCNPSVSSICEDMARWCLKTDIRGQKGQNPRAGTIRNTVLGAGHWTPPHHSIAQAIEHVAQIARTARTEVARTAR